MTVFKCYMKIIKKNVGMILMYFVIFAVISIAMFYVSTGDNANGKFTSSKLNTGIVDNDKSNVSEKLAEYLSKLHNADMLEYNIGVFVGLNLLTLLTVGSLGISGLGLLYGISAFGIL